MRTPRRLEPRATAPLGLLAVGAALALLLAGGGGAGGGTVAPQAPAPAAWAGLVGGPRPLVFAGQRVLVVLKAPSLADRLAAAGGTADAADERRWTSSAQTAQRRLISRLAIEGVLVRPEYSYTRVLNGFSAAIDARGIGLLDGAPEVAGVYPVRAAYPASVSGSQAPRAVPDGGLGHRIALPGRDGRGVTIALLDTGVDRAQPYLRGRVLPGYDILRRHGDALPGAKPGDPASIEEHGTELAGVLVGAGGPSGLAGVATGATILPLRVAGWQPDAAGEWSVYARTDEIVAGLERAVDSNGDGDTHDAARIALIGLAAPYAAFADDPVARAAEGASRLGTLVVTAAGNDGPAGPDFGSIAGPGGAPAALTVGAADLRQSGDQVRLVVRAGLRVLLNEVVPLAGAVAPRHAIHLRVALPRPAEDGSSVPGIGAFFDRRGFSLVAGRAALAPRSKAPRDVAEAAALAGAAAVLLDGARLPSGSVGVDERAPVPVIGLSAAAGSALRAALESGADVGVSIGPLRSALNPAHGRVAAFSSQGLAFDGRVKPDLVGPGVGVLTSAPGGFETVSGTSLAAAAVAGAAALLAEARPELDATALKGALVGTAAPLAADSLGAQGAGLVDVSAAASAELVAEPATLALGRATRAGWSARRVLVIRNISSRPRIVRVSVESTSAVSLSARPRRLTIPPGGSRRVALVARAEVAPAGAPPAEGVLQLTVAGAPTARVPWAVAFGAAPRDLVSRVRLLSPILHAGSLAPALLTLRLGLFRPSTRGSGQAAVTPVSRFDIELRDADGQALGLLTRVRDALPGTYAFAVTGRAPSGAPLAPGSYTLRLVAFPTDGGPATVRTVGIAVR
jgi:subtilisin family serine protease